MPSELSTLLRELPGGEWGDVELVPVGGLMRGRAIFARATWLRRGGVPAFIKLILPAASGAGDTTALVANSGHLESVYRRLLEIRERQTLPFVPLLDVHFTAERGLLIAMERVDCLSDLISDGRAGPDVAAVVLRSLDQERVGSFIDWHHFDICPRNLGLTTRGNAVFIDLESVYFAQKDNRINVTVAAFKQVRLPRVLRAKLMEHLAMQGAGMVGVPSSLAMQKYKYEVILAAAEACLGELPPIFEEDLAVWLQRWPQGDACEALKDGLSRALVEPDKVRLANLAGALLAKPEGPAPKVKLIPSQADPAISLRTTSENHYEGAAEPPTEWELAFNRLEEQTRALRRGELVGAPMLAYQKSLEQIVADAPGARPVWEELLVIAVSYRRDPEDARAVIGAALSAIPGDTEFLQWRQILQLWRKSA